MTTGPADLPRRRRALKPATVAVHAGRPVAEPDGPLSPPVVFASTYHAGGPVAYGRDGNTTWTALEDAIGALEGGTAVAFASGMAAISAVLEGLPNGAVVVSSADAYNGTRRLLRERAAVGRVVLREVDIASTKAVLDACDGAAVLWAESPTNPRMDIADLPALAEGARERGAVMVVDNTFATPLAQRPLDLGAEVVVHSVTKFLAGHSDVVLGAAVARDESTCARLRHRRSLLGAIPGPMEAWLALRGIRTLPVRMEKAQANAAELAQRLAGHPQITEVRYPGLYTDPGYERAVRQMLGFGAMVSFEIQGGADPAEAFACALRLVLHATSLGGIETTLERRHRWPGEEQTPPGLIRMSAGCEDVDDLWDDITHALTIAAVS